VDFNYLGVWGDNIINSILYLSLKDVLTGYCSCMCVQILHVYLIPLPVFLLYIPELRRGWYMHVFVCDVVFDFLSNFCQLIYGIVFHSFCAGAWIGACLIHSLGLFIWSIILQ
jgi:hypothetical protein